MFLKKSRFVAVALGATCGVAGLAVGAFIAQGATTPHPEVDKANATIQLGVSTPLVGTSCLGEDKLASGARVPYITYKGAFTGGETESAALVGESDYPLSGTLTVSNIVWTINLNTDRGVLVGTAVLTSPPGATTTTIYSGRMVVVTQGNPAATSGPTAGRGYITAAIKLPDEGLTPGDDSLIANVEFPSINLGGASGSFGDGALAVPQIPDFSVVRNAQAC